MSFPSGRPTSREVSLSPSAPTLPQSSAPHQVAARRWIAHLDMDAFFASVELLKYPELRGEPVVIGGGRLQQPVLQEDGTRQFARMRDYVGRGVVTTSTYAARAFGVFSAMGIMKAAKLAPDSILLPADFEAYRDYSARFKQAVANLCPIIQNVGIDEIYVDLTEHGEQAPAMAARLKAAVFEATGLSCSIGLAPNKLLAKICSDLEKPDGLTILSPEDVEMRVWPLPAKKINGIGPKATAKLEAWLAEAPQFAPAPLLELPIWYAGEDLATVAAACDLSGSEVIALHSGVEYRVGAIGFAPGFAYLSELDGRLALPRRSTPRTHVPAGSLAIAERQTAIYPQASPGGWHLLGRCPWSLFDWQAAQPCRLALGDRVRFVAIDQHTYLAEGGAP